MVMESDDWGSIRNPVLEDHMEASEELRRKSLDPFYRYDGLEGDEDIRMLMECLGAFKDQKGRPPVLTMNFAVANPDFEGIRQSNFASYALEPFEKTYQRAARHKQTLALLKMGMELGLFFPQFHCREHVNVHRWMKDLKNEGKDGNKLRIAFSMGMIATEDCTSPSNRYGYMDSFNYDTPSQRQDLAPIVAEGMQLFRDIFGYSSQSFIASCYIWDDFVEGLLLQEGVHYIQGGKAQWIPGAAEGTLQLNRRSHYIGEKNKEGQIYLVRNAIFEPTWNEEVDWVERCLKDMEFAFSRQKPATISTHRLNYIGTFSRENREKNVERLGTLLRSALKRWPELEFISTAELGLRMKG